MKSWSHVHQRIGEHEKSKMHRDSADAYLLLANRADNQMCLCHDQVKKKRQVMERIMDMVKVIRKCGLGDKAEGAYTLLNHTLVVVQKAS